MSTTMNLTIESQGVSDVGAVRKVNEDACLNRTDLQLWVVADGMGGHDAGDVASQKIVETLGQLPADLSLADLADWVDSALVRVNAELVTLARDAKARTIGSTVVAMAIRGKHAICFWAGDSRVYRSRKGKLEQLTQDHAMVEDMVEIGLLSREEAENHPQANRITRAIGASDDLFVDIDIFEIQPGDHFLLCSDGLYKELSDKDIGQVMKKHGWKNAAQVAVDMALSRGARDNVTVVTVGAQ